MREKDPHVIFPMLTGIAGSERGIAMQPGSSTGLVVDILLKETARLLCLLAAPALIVLRPR